MISDVGSATLIRGDCRDHVPKSFGAVVIDPEWGHMDREFIGRVAREGECIGFCDAQRAGDLILSVGRPPTWVFTWDCVSSWFVPGWPLRRSKHALWFSDTPRYVDRVAIRPRSQGDAPRMVTNTRSTYLFTPDEMGVRMTDVYKLPITEFAATRMHPHEKPYEWCRCLLMNCVGPDHVVFDPYMGSGVFAQICISEGIRYIGVEIDALVYDDTVSFLKEVFKCRNGLI